MAAALCLLLLTLVCVGGLSASLCADAAQEKHGCAGPGRDACDHDATDGEHGEDPEGFLRSASAVVPCHLTEGLTRSPLARRISSLHRDVPPPIPICA